MSSNFISDEILDTVLHHFDIVDVIGQYVPLKKSGRNYFGLCPFHSEKTPSFSVSPEKQIYHCFGCGEGGNVIRFIMGMESLNFKEAIVHLANEANIFIPNMNETAPSDPKEQEKSKLLRAYELTGKLYHYLLIETDYGKEALKYLAKRGFSRELIETFNIGYSPPAWDTLKKFLLKRDFTIDVIEQAGLIIKNDNGKAYDRFRNRIIFPIYDVQGKVIAFGGRVLDDSLPKYLNSPETLIFNKSKSLYNLNLARKEIRKKRQAILLEGYADTIAVWGAGIYNAVATLGTSLTEEQARILRRHAEEIIIGYDSDLAGQQAAYRAIDILQDAGLRVKVLQLPKGSDPDDYIRKFGADSFKQKVYDSTLTAISFKLQYLKKDFNLKDGADRMRYLTAALEIISDLQHAVEREHYLKGVAEEFQISYHSLKNDLTQIYYEKRKKKENSRDNLTVKWNNIINNGNPVIKHKSLYPAYYNAERNLVCLMMRDRQVAEKVQQEIGSEFHVEDFAVLAAYLYSYYGKGYGSDINRFFSTIGDEYYIKLASQLAMLEVNENVTEEELTDYILQVKKYNLDLEIKKKREEQLKAERNNDYERSVQIGQEIIQLRNQMKWGKM